MTTITDRFLTYANAKNDGDLETAMGVWHPDALLKIPAVDLTLEGRNQARAFFAKFLDALEGYRGEVVHVGVNDDTVLADWVLRGKLTGPILGAEPTGAELELPVLSIVEIRDGLFVAETLRFDLARLARQAGIPLDQLIDQLDLQQGSNGDRQDGTTSQTEHLDLPSGHDPADVQANHHVTSGTRAFLDAFIEGWQTPESVEQFLDHFLPHVDADVRLRQPLGTELGHAGFVRVFRRLFTLMPDVHGEVQEAIPLPNGLLIVFTMRGSLGRSSYEWTVVDRVTLRDGRLIEREAFFDPLPLFAAIVRRPSAWPRALRSLLI